MIDEALEKIRQEFQASIEAVAGAEDLASVRTRFLGRKAGLLTHALKGLKSLPADQKPAAGQAANKLRAEIENGLKAAGEKLKSQAGAATGPSLDPTLPGVPRTSGSIHPVTQVWREIEQIFLAMGYTIDEGPQVETDWYNFEALNIPPDHPARDLADTLYLKGGGLLRTHTSPIQIRTMQRVPPPLKMIAVGKVFRRDPFDPSHSPMFHQVEGLVVGEGISMAHLKGTVREFMRRFFRKDLKVRLRPGYFPFVEPGAEFDVSCMICAGAGCSTCKRTGWIEMGGAGMVHPNVFKAVGYDSEKYTGFAFGLGVDRIAMIRYNINDIRLLFESDLRFLSQFRGLP